MSAPGRVTLPTRVPVLSVGGGLSLKLVLNFGSRRESECDKICEKVEKIHRVVADQVNYIHPCAMAIFLDFVNRFFEARMEYYSQHNEQGRHFNGRPKANANKLIELGTTAYREGVAVSTAGSSTKSSCKIYHHNPPKDSEGRCLLCFADLPLSEPQAGTGAFLSWEAYLNTFEREDILRAMNQDSQVIEGSPGAPETTHTVESTGGNYLGLESVSESEIPSMWRSFTSLFTPRRRGGESAGQ